LMTLQDRWTELTELSFATELHSSYDIHTQDSDISSKETSHA